MMLVSGNLEIYILAGFAASVLSATYIRRLARKSGSNPGYESVGVPGVSSPECTGTYYAAAWRDRRGRMVVFKTLQFSFFPMLLALWYLSSIHPQWHQQLYAFPCWFIGFLAAGVWLNRFRCPRCRNLYYWRVQVKGSTERQKRWRDCHYCGLHQGECPIC